MPRYAPVWSEIARQQYNSLPLDKQHLVDAKVEQLLEEPTADADARYDRRFDQWSVPFDDGMSLIVYAAVRDHRKIILLRIV
jgi:hypothetical protein